MKACQEVGGWAVWFCQKSGWYVCVSVPVLSGSWDKPRCAPGPCEFIAKKITQMAIWE